MTSSSPLPSTPRRSREELDADCVDVMLFLGRMSVPQLRTDVYASRACGGDTRRADTALRACVRTGRVLQIAQPGMHDLFQLAPIRQALTGRAESQTPLFVVVPARNPKSLLEPRVELAQPAKPVDPAEPVVESDEVDVDTRKRIFRKPDVRRAARHAALLDVLTHGPSKSGEVARRISGDAGVVERDLFALTKPQRLRSRADGVQDMRTHFCLLERTNPDGPWMYAIPSGAAGREAVLAELGIPDYPVGYAWDVPAEDRPPAPTPEISVPDAIPPVSSRAPSTPLSGASFAEVGRVMDDARDRGEDPLGALLARWYTGEPEIAAACATIAGYEAALEALRVARDEAARVLRLSRERAHRDLVALFEAGLRGDAS